MQGKTLRYIRNALNLSLNELAERLNVALTTVYRWENDRQGICGENMRRLEHVLGYTPDDLIEIERLLLDRKNAQLKAKLRKQAEL